MKEKIIEMQEQEGLVEQLKTIVNLGLVAQLLIKEKHRELLPTILEFLFQEAQSIMDSHCVGKA